MTLARMYLAAFLLAVAWGITAHLFGINGLAFEAVVFVGALIAFTCAARAIER